MQFESSDIEDGAGLYICACFVWRHFLGQWKALLLVCISLLSGNRREARIPTLIVELAQGTVFGREQAAEQQKEFRGCFRKRLCNVGHDVLYCWGVCGSSE